MLVIKENAVRSTYKGRFAIGMKFLGLESQNRPSYVWIADNTRMMATIVQIMHSDYLTPKYYNRCSSENLEHIPLASWGFCVKDGEEVA